MRAARCARFSRAVGTSSTAGWWRIRRPATRCAFRGVCEPYFCVPYQRPGRFDLLWLYDDRGERTRIGLRLTLWDLQIIALPRFECTRGGYCLVRSRGIVGRRNRAPRTCRPASPKDSPCRGIRRSRGPISRFALQRPLVALRFLLVHLTETFLISYGPRACRRRRRLSVGVLPGE